MGSFLPENMPITSWAVLAFSILFLVVGVSRVVEFQGVDISDKQRRFLIPLHILGVLSFSAAMGLLAIDPAQVHRTLLAGLFFGGMLILFPMHIYVAIKRKIRVNK
jgi:hypothetical protein